MSEIDVPDYYELAAAHFDSVWAVVGQAIAELPKPDRSSTFITEILRHEWDDSMAFMATADALKQEDQLSPAVKGLLPRHRIRNHLQGFIDLCRSLPQGSETRYKLYRLIAKANNLTWADMLEQRPDWYMDPNMVR